ncbi:hypothetical protein RDI58_017705 [Solanum bulbocastanum]|uniref:DUF4283 domain-containing protein n=1 Tax=Solanum bulbocastanum TaxID=147425 RepID=A0AAN8TI74_SOLBU
MIAANKEKGKTIVNEQWPELSKQRKTGSGSQQILLGSNGIVTQGKPNNTQRTLELNGEDGKKPWVNLFATNRLVTRDGYFVVRFANEEERDMVLFLRPHHLLRRPVIMKPWVLEFNFKEEILTTIPLWGQEQRKEWIPTTNKEQGIGKVQVEDNQQEKSDNEKEETLQGQDNGRLLDIELLSKKNVGTIKIQGKNRAWNQG